MSSLLEQAIIDATALKEAALKNAEAQVLERYSTDVKEVFRCWRWDIYLDDEGNIDSIFFNCEKIAPVYISEILQTL